MKKLIFLLFLMLIACAPVATIPPTTTALPPSPTITPSPTATPNPTATPSAPREAEGGVQVFENGKWVELKAPEGIWGPVEGTKVILVGDSEGQLTAYIEVELNDFRTPEGSNSVNVAKYNETTESWELLPFSFTRSGPENINFSPLNNNLTRHDVGPRIDNITSVATVLGLKFDGASLDVMILFKGEVRVLGLDGLNIYENVFSPTDPTVAAGRWKIIAPEDMGVSDAVEAITKLNKSLWLGRAPVDPIFSFIVASPGTTVEDCVEISNYYYDDPILESWCKSQVVLGKDRKVPSRSEIGWVLTHPQTIGIDQSSEFPDLDSLWNSAVVPEIEGVFVELQLSKSRP